MNASEICPVFAGETISKELETFLEEGKFKGTKLFMLVDSNTARDCLPVMLKGFTNETAFTRILIPAGEENKNINTVIHIWEMLGSSEAGRDALLINLGGGVVCDLGGFAASTYKRGISYINVPTTLLAQVDAAMGGKTGFNLDHIKNSIGTFAMPEAVFIQRKFLDTLSEKHTRNGFAEMLKYGLIGDKSLWNDLKNKLPQGRTDLGLISRCVTIKNEIIYEDPKEKGLRKILNFGHTVGHALESASMETGITSLLHGEAIAAGMICEAFLSNRYAGLTAAELEDIRDTIINIFGVIPITGMSKPEILKRMRNDKKNASGNIGFTLIPEIGKSVYDRYISEADIAESLDYYIKSCKG